MKTRFTLSKALIALALLPATQSFGQSTQAVTGAITSYGGYWKSKTDSLNATHPDNSHDLLAFTYNGTMYSTGVNDAALTLHSETFIPQVFQALPIGGISGTPTANTKIALGQLYDGVNNGPAVTAPSNSMPLYLNDGVNGLNLGTGVANLPAGSLTFNIPALNSTYINDGIPDVLITQIAEPTGGVDYYKFTDINGNTVGDSIGISFDGISAVGTWIGDFYEASQNPMTLSTGFTNSPRPIRMWTADVSLFGINATNAASVKNFVIKLNGNSDVAFIAYNAALTTITNPLPVSLAYFTARPQDNDARLDWRTLQESEGAYFDVESSVDGKIFKAVTRIKSAVNSNSPKDYGYIDKDILVPHYYRLKQVDISGQATYSDVRFVVPAKTGGNGSMILSPNPANDILLIHAAPVAYDRQLDIYALDGKRIISQKFPGGYTDFSISLSNFVKGTYIADLHSSRNKESQRSRFTVR